MAENDRLARAPILVEDLRAIGRGDRAHALLPPLVWALTPKRPSRQRNPSLFHARSIRSFIDMIGSSSFTTAISRSRHEVAGSGPVASVLYPQVLSFFTNTHT